MHRFSSILVLLGWSNLANLISADWIGPLTTTFTPPASCFRTTAIFALHDYGDYTLTDFFGVGLGMAASVYHISANPGTSCYPPRYNASDWVIQRDYYSPGVCPSGYTLATADPITSPSLYPWTDPVTTRTWGICCPPGFEADGEQCSRHMNVRTIAVDAVVNIHYNRLPWDGAPAPITSRATVVSDRGRTTDVTVYASAISIYYGMKTSTPTSTSLSSTSTSAGTAVSVDGTCSVIAAIICMAMFLT